MGAQNFRIIKNNISRRKFQPIFSKLRVFGKFSKNSGLGKICWTFRREILWMNLLIKKNCWIKKKLIEKKLKIDFFQLHRS